MTRCWGERWSFASVNFRGLLLFRQSPKMLDVRGIPVANAYQSKPERNEREGMWVEINRFQPGSMAKFPGTRSKIQKKIINLKGQQMHIQCSITYLNRLTHPSSCSCTQPITFPTVASCHPCLSHMANSFPRALNSKEPSPHTLYRRLGTICHAANLLANTFSQITAQPKSSEEGRFRNIWQASLITT